LKPEAGLRRKITVIFLFILGAHLFISLALTFFPERHILGGTKVAVIYYYLVHIGPFYSEKAIESSPHFVVQVRGKEVDLISAHISQYQEKPWRINELTLGDHVRKTADAFRKHQAMGTRAHLNLMAATRKILTEIQPGDSVRWVYYHRRYYPDNDTWNNDTVFQFRFKWME
jgi:hypothetical protein